MYLFIVIIYNCSGSVPWGWTVAGMLVLKKVSPLVFMYNYACTCIHVFSYLNYIVYLVYFLFEPLPTRNF